MAARKKKEMEKELDNYCVIKDIGNSKAIKIIERSDYLISISLNEGLGRNAMEAQLLGKPVIASKDCGYEDIIEDGTEGILVDPKNLKEIKKAIKNINKIDLINKYSHEDYIQKIIKIYGGI